MHKIIKIIALVLSLLGIAFLINIISTGDDAIKAAALDGDTSIVDPIAYIAYAVLIVILVFVLISVVKNLTSGKGLGKTLIGFGVLAGILLISYLVSGGDTKEYFYNGITATPSQSQLVGGGLVAFYILILAAAATMLLSGVKKMFS